MHGAVDNKKRSVTAANSVAHFSKTGALISIAAPDMLSALRTSWTEAEETAKSCPLTRTR